MNEEFVINHWLSMYLNLHERKILTRREYDRISLIPVSGEKISDILVLDKLEVVRKEFCENKKRFYRKHGTSFTLNFQ